jgi:hypothetical protein
MAWIEETRNTYKIWLENLMGKDHYVHMGINRAMVDGQTDRSGDKSIFVLFEVVCAVQFMQHVLNRTRLCIIGR